MLAEAQNAVLGWTTALVALIGAILSVLKYFDFQTKRDREQTERERHQREADALRQREAEVAEVFENVVSTLGTGTEVERLAASIRLRRFFDPASALGADGAYADEAQGVIAGVLRVEPSGNLQKALGDGLACARSLEGADLQRTNLQGVYLGQTTVAGADFYRADLSRGSLKDADGRGAVFYQTRMLDTVLKGADLRGAYFYGADLTGAALERARLGGATFIGCRGLPAVVRDQLDDEGRFPDTGEELVLEDEMKPGRRTVFVSRPSTLTATQRAALRAVEQVLTANEVRTVTVDRQDYPASGILGDIRTAMSSCNGVVVFGFRQLVVDQGRWRPGTSEERALDGTALTTPWNHVEAGMAAGLGLPVYLISEPGVEGGVFDLPGDVTTFATTIDGAVDDTSLDTSLVTWLGQAMRRSARGVEDTATG